MNKINTLVLVLFSLTLFYSCNQTPTNDKESAADSGSKTTETEQVGVDEAGEEKEVAEVEQTVDERINEIKQLYGEIQKAQKNKNACTSKTKTTYDGLNENYPFENKAKECELENDLAYQQLTLNGYEWSETCTFYLKDNKRFFAFLSGGAEACAYDYRVYYNKDGEVIRVLLAENECDGNEVSSSHDVTTSKRREEVLKSIENAEKEFKSILGK